MTGGMPEYGPDSWSAAVARRLLRVVPSLGVKPEWLFRLPSIEETEAGSEVRKIEVISHCWNYAHLLVYQLSSLALAPPQNVHVTMTVCYCEEDADTVDLLRFFAEQERKRVTWNWIALPREALLRRAVGRNVAARRSQADWVWFTDCDVVFAEGCCDALAASLSGRRESLVFPQEERTTRMLAPEDPMLAFREGGWSIRPVDFSEFMVQRPRKATGPLQIARGDYARSWGYCGAVKCYQTTTDHWQKTYEDRVFRWLLGTAGSPVDIPGVYRIKHVEKGRYRQGGWSRLRSLIRRRQDAGRVGEESP